MVRRDPLGRIKGMGGSVAGRMRWEREGSTGSRRRTCVEPESARMGEKHNRGGKGLSRRNRQIPKRQRRLGETGDWFGGDY